MPVRDYTGEFRIDPAGDAAGLRHRFGEAL